MKRHLLTIGAVAVAVFATQQAAQATLEVLVDSGTGQTGADLVGGQPPYSPLVVNYDVFFNVNSSDYTYIFSFTAFAPYPINPFTVGASYVSDVYGYGDSLAAYGNLGSGFGTTVTGNYDANSSYPGLIVWDLPVTYGNHQPYGPGNPQPMETVAYTSNFGPTAGLASAIGGALSWETVGIGGSPVPVPSAPVPEASTVMAGALMLLPFGIGAIRSLRKERGV